MLVSRGGRSCISLLSDMANMSTIAFVINKQEVRFDLYERNVFVVSADDVCIHEQSSALDDSANYDYTMFIVVYNVTDRKSFTHATDQLFAQMYESSKAPTIAMASMSCARLFGRWASSRRRRPDVLLVANKGDLQRRRKVNNNGEPAQDKHQQMISDAP